MKLFYIVWTAFRNGGQCREPSKLKNLLFVSLCMPKWLYQRSKNKNTLIKIKQTATWCFEHTFFREKERFCLFSLYTMFFITLDCHVCCVFWLALYQLIKCHTLKHLKFHFDFIYCENENRFPSSNDFPNEEKKVIEFKIHSISKSAHTKNWRVLLLLPPPAAIIVLFDPFSPLKQILSVNMRK